MKDVAVAAEEVARRLARTVLEPPTADTLEQLADEYDSKAVALGGPRAIGGRSH
jgi:hypothetical protein